jgi:putative ABC transport system permease protein
MMSRFLFSFVFAYRNIMKYKLRSLLFILSFIALLSALMLSLSLRGFINKYYFYDLEQTYQDINLMIKTSESANARYFSIRALDERLDPNEYIDAYASFFEIPALIHIDQTEVFVHMMLGNTSDLSFVSKHEITSVLSHNEVIITQSFASRNHLNVGDLLTLDILTNTYTYQVKEILVDQGIFQGDSVFMLKEGNLSTILKTLYPSLSNLPNSILRNLQNVVYLKYNDTYTFDAVETYLRGLSGYSNLNMNPPYNINQIESNINRSYALVSVVLWMIILAIVLVMQTTIMVYFNDKKKKIATIDLLGGKSSFSYFIICIEFFFFFLISLLCSIYLSNLIYSFGNRFVGIRFDYQVTSKSIFFSSVSTILLFLFISFYYFKKFKKKSSIEGIKESFSVYKNQLVFLLILSSIFLGLYFLSDLLFNAELSTLLKITSFFIVLFSIPYLLIHLWIRLFKNKDNKRMFHLKIMLGAKSFKQYTFMLLISLSSIFLLVLANHHINDKVNVYLNEVKIDYLMTNFTTKYDDTYLLVSALNEVGFVSKATLYEGIYFSDLNHSIDLTVSMNQTEIGHYFNFDFESINLLALDDLSQPVILLPNDFKHLYHLNIGDYIKADISSEFYDIEFLIGGFFEKKLGNLAFTNLSLVSNYQNAGSRVLLIASEDKTLYQTLINQYSPSFIFVIDYQSIIINQATFMQKTIQYLNIVMSIIILCFVLGILNHSILVFDEMKKNYARMHILGLSKFNIQKMIIEEGMIYFLFLLVSSIVSYLLLSNILMEIILMFGAYELVYSGLESILLSSLIVFILFILIRFVYIMNIFKLNSNSVLRLYE